MNYKRTKILNYSQFIEKLKTIKTATSVQQNAGYTITEITEQYVLGIREDADGKPKFKIKVEELYKVHAQKTEINTNILREYITGRVYSPALAILIEMGIYDR